MATFVNLTPHTINEVTTGLNLPPSGVVARVAVSNTVIDVINGVEIYATTYGEVLDLPEPKLGVYYIVSSLVLLACPDRKDLLAPGEIVRNADGQPIGCKGFRRA
jgi:hypothetical protein